MLPWPHNPAMGHPRTSSVLKKDLQENTVRKVTQRFLAENSGNILKKSSWNHFTNVKKIRNQTWKVSRNAKCKIQQSQLKYSS